MSSPSESIVPKLHEGYWVKVGDDSYAVDKIVGVSLAVPDALPSDDLWTIPLLVVVVAGGCAGSYLLDSGWGFLAGSIAVLLVVGLVIKVLEKKESPKELRNVVIDMGKKGDRVVALRIPLDEAEKLKLEIEALVAKAAADMASRDRKVSV